jgi:hypothetical protein
MTLLLTALAQQKPVVTVKSPAPCGDDPPADPLASHGVWFWSFLMGQNHISK